MTDGGSLQFDRVEQPAGPAACGRCKRPLGSLYFQANGVVVCETCRAEIEASWSAGTTESRFVKALIWGVGAAVLGTAIYFGFTAITGFELSLIAILVGYLVGRAVRHGSGGRGGASYQGLAVFLTYSAIVFSYGLLIVRASPLISLPGLFTRLGFLYTLPFQAGARSIMGLVIIAIGLYEAWALNKPGSISVTGPYRVGGPTPTQPA